MSTRMEGFPWERRAHETEAAYAAFRAYRDLGPRRTHEAARERLGKRPDELKPIEHWSVYWDWRRRAGAWDALLQADRDKVAAENAALWERRRLQTLEEGWQLCWALRAGLMQMLDVPPEAPDVAPSEPAAEASEALPEAVATPEATAGPGAVGRNYLTLARLAKLVGELEWALLAEALPPPPEIDPLTATPEELDAYLARHPRLNHPPR